jgi:hypothetical protein
VLLVVVVRGSAHRVVRARAASAFARAEFVPEPPQFDSSVLFAFSKNDAQRESPPGQRWAFRFAEA